MDYMPFDPDALANWAAAEKRSARLKAERAHAITPPLSPEYSSDSDYTILSFPPPRNFQSPDNPKPITHTVDVATASSLTSNDAWTLLSPPMRVQKKSTTREKKQRSTTIASGR
ncbi:hypothetical protein MMC30_000084 [Trapelia coarctata]|nr:hypothetical protein [Trapelia coarctata]